MTDTPSRATNHDRLSNVRVSAAYLMRATNGPIQTHSAWLFVTEDNRVIISRGGAELEPRQAHFGSVIRPSLLAHFGLASVESTYNFGRLVATTQELAEVASRTNAERSAAEDAQTTTVDTVNFMEVAQAHGIKGLRPRPGVEITLMEADHARAQNLFQAALDVNRMLDEAPFAYAPMPQGDGRTGINSHTYTALVAERADERTGRRGASYLQTYANQSSLLVGASTARWGFAGPSLQTVRDLARPEHAGDRRPRGTRTIPYEHLMPYAQGSRPGRRSEAVMSPQAAPASSSDVVVPGATAVAAREEGAAMLATEMRCLTSSVGDAVAPQRAARPVSRNRAAAARPSCGRGSQTPQQHAPVAWPSWAEKAFHP